MSYLSEILDKANNLNFNSTASDLYLFAKAISDAGITDVPKIFVQAVKARLLNSGTVDPNEIAYLQKILNFTNAWALQGAWFTNDGVVRTIGNAIKTYPTFTVADLISPHQIAIFNTPGNWDFLQAQRINIPSWYKDSTLFRVRVWGAGGGGARNDTSGTSYNVGGGGGGGYAEGLVTYAAIKANSSLSVGSGGGGATGSATPGGAGQASAFSTVLSATGGGGGAVSTGAMNTGAPGGSGSGAAVLAVAQGGNGGYRIYPAPGDGSWSFCSGAGGGAAGGPWGNGGPGGTVDVPGTDSHGGGGGGTNGAGAFSSATDRNGGVSAIYQERWKTAFLQSLGGNPVVTAQRHGGFGAGGAGGSLVKNGNIVLDPIRNGGNGGAFGGGGGLGSAGSSGGGSSASYSAGHGGIGGGGGAASVYSGGTAGNGGNGLVIVEWFI